MGTRNKERRRAKRLKEARRGKGSSGDPWRAAGGGAERARGREADSAGLAITLLILQTVHAECEGRADRPQLVRRLIEAYGDRFGRPAVAAELTRIMRNDVEEALRGGWEPDEIARVARRKARAAGSALAVASLSDAVHRRPSGEQRSRWARQLSALGGGRALDLEDPGWGRDADAALSVIELLAHLPMLPELDRMRDVASSGGSRPSTGRRGPEATEQLDRIRSLLAKAEATEFEAEADAFTAKAQELMTKYSLTRAMLEAGAPRQELDVRRCWIEAPYVNEKALLLSVVASANRCRSVLDPLGYSTLVGHPDDLDVTELLFTSLLVQATRRMTVAGEAGTTGPTAAPTTPSLSDRLAEILAQETADMDGAEAARLVADALAAFGRRPTSLPSYRRSFLVAYATRIGQRLAGANDTATAEVRHEVGSRLLPVLARRAGAVDDAIDRIFGQLDNQRMAVTNRQGWMAGTAAAELADLAIRGQLAG